MSIRGSARLLGFVLLVVLTGRVAVGYIHFPPMTLQKMCKFSSNIRVLRIHKFDKEKGQIAFELVSPLKGQNPKELSFRHSIGTDIEVTKPILDWIGDKKEAVLFTIEGGNIACGYVFIDDFCYSVDYNWAGKYWLLIRAEPNMSACYHGSPQHLQKLVKEILDGNEVTVPVKEPASPVSQSDRDKRVKEVNDVLIRNRGNGPGSSQ